jgi:carboxypeptidase PM20D1
MFGKIVVVLTIVAVFVAYGVWNHQQVAPVVYLELKHKSSVTSIRDWSDKLKNEAIQRFSKSITFETLTYEHNTTEFQNLFSHLKSSFPLVHQKLIVEHVGPYSSLLFTWKGKSNKSPVLYTAHFDVVPAPQPEQWSVPAFSGTVKDGYVYGRGTLDFKVGALAQLEAVEQLLKDNYVPERTIYLSYGCDEERSGKKGAAEITNLLASRGVELEIVHDEGGLIAVGQFPTIEKPIALVATCEKGFINVELKVECDPGHASMPSQNGCIGILSQGIVTIESTPMKSHVSVGIFSDLMRHLAPFSNPIGKFLLSHTSSLKPILTFAFGKIPTTNALIRTTIAPTIFRSGVKDNVLPGTAMASLNIRIHPSDKIDDVYNHLRSILDDKIKVTVLPNDRNEASKVACTNCLPFNTIFKTVEQVFPDVIVSPFLFVAASDSRHYRKISKNSYGFTPFYMPKQEMNKFHGFDERISTKNYIDLIQYFHTLIINVDKNI